VMLQSMRTHIAKMKKEMSPSQYNEAVLKLLSKYHPGKALSVQ
jgi:hypothetical protein